MGQCLGSIAKPAPSRHSSRSSKSDTHYGTFNNGSREHLINSRVRHSSRTTLESTSPGDTSTLRSTLPVPSSPPSDANQNIWDLAHNGGHPTSRIVLNKDLENYWLTGPASRRFYEHLPWYVSHCIKHPKFDIRPWLRILSIAVVSGFQSWTEFDKIFILPTKRRDENLPFDLQALRDESFLGPILGMNFYNNQPPFCPLVLQQRKEPHALVDGEFTWRLPFVGTSLEIGEGSSSTVTKEIVAPFHLQYSGDGRPSLNMQAKAVACKKVNRDTVERVEFENLKSLRKCLSHHSRILVNITTIFRDLGPGDVANWILYDLAAFDLEVFLKNPLQQARKLRHGSSPKGRNDSHAIWSGHLIEESRNLADALDFLHNRLYYDAQVSCAHNDLKPENILVFSYDSPNPEDKDPVGQWKIADFGIARIKEKRIGSQSPGYLSPKLTSRKIDTDKTHRRPSVSKTKAKRNPGKYTAPEVEAMDGSDVDGRKADIWSFGAVFCEVLAYAVGLGPHLVAELRQESRLNNEERYYNSADPERNVNPRIIRWLELLSTKSDVEIPKDGVRWGDGEISEDNDRSEDDARLANAKWIEECVKLIKRMLERNPDDRPSANTIRDQLQKIFKLIGRDKRWLRDVPLDEEEEAPTSWIKGGYQEAHRGSGASCYSESPESTHHSIIPEIRRSKH